MRSRGAAAELQYRRDTVFPVATMPLQTYHALSLKQPWAALLAAGRKTVEVRRWPTTFRGRLLIHAARIPDPRREAWKHLPDDLTDLARLEGGIIGAGTLTGCKRYRRSADFDKDCSLHLNDPSWFEPAGLYGFCFDQLRLLPFQRVPGYVRIFTVELEPFEDPVEPTTAPAGALQRICRLLLSLSPVRRRNRPLPPKE